MTDTILIVDDEKFLCLSLARLLKKSGYATQIALTGPEAFRLVEREPARFRLALIDLHMPGWPGEETARRLKTVSPNLKIIIMTGYSPNFSANGQAHELDPKIGDALLFKPFEKGAVIQTVEKLLKP